MTKGTLFLVALVAAISAQAAQTTKLDFINNSAKNYKFIVGTTDSPPRFVGTNYRLPKNSRQILEVPAPIFRLLVYENIPQANGHIFKFLTGDQPLAAIRIKKAPELTIEPQTHLRLAIPGNITKNDITLVKSGPLLDLITESEGDDYALLGYLDAKDIHGIEELFSGQRPLNVNPNHKNDALIFAAKYGKPGVVYSIITAGANVNALDADGYSVLYHAMRSQPEAAQHTLRILIDQGALIDAPDAHGFTALMRAAQLNKLFAVRLLLNAQADPSITNPHDDNKTACDYATNPQIKKMLCNN